MASDDVVSMGEDRVAALLESVRSLAETERHRCLWFMREGAVTDVASALEVLRQVEQHGDLQAFKRAGQLRKELARAAAGAPG